MEENPGNGAGQKVDWAVISDFDGTITSLDTNALLFSRLGNQANQEIEEKFKRGEMGTREAMRLHFEQFRITEEEFFAFLDTNISLDPFFRDFVQMLKTRRIPLIVVSAGFSNTIRFLFEREGIPDYACIRANKLHFSGDRARVEFLWPPFSCPRGEEGCGHCKVEVVEKMRARGRKVLFIGDGLTDRCAAEKADLILARSQLARYCREKGLPYYGFRDFSQIKSILPKK